MSSRSGSPSESPSSKKEQSKKVFVTNIDGQKSEEIVEVQLRKLFQPHGSISKLNVKRHKNGLYSFAFLEYETSEQAVNSIKELDQYELFGKKMRVRQDRQSQGCFHCKKTGHFARQCPQKNPEKQQYDKTRDFRERRYENRHHEKRQFDRGGYRHQYRRRQRSRSSSGDRRRHYRRRSPSYSSQRHYHRRHRDHRDYHDQRRYERHDRHDRNDRHDRHDRHDRYDRYERYDDRRRGRRGISSQRSRSRSQG